MSRSAAFAEPPGDLLATRVEISATFAPGAPLESHRHRGGVRPGREDVRDRRAGGRFLAGGCGLPASGLANGVVADVHGTMVSAGGRLVASEIRLVSTAVPGVREFEGGDRRHRHRLRESGELPRERAADRRSQRHGDRRHGGDAGQWRQGRGRGPAHAGRGGRLEDRNRRGGRDHARREGRSRRCVGAHAERATLRA